MKPLHRYLSFLLLVAFSLAAGSVLWTRLSPSPAAPPAPAREAKRPEPTLPVAPPEDTALPGASTPPETPEPVQATKTPSPEPTVPDPPAPVPPAQEPEVRSVPVPPVKVPPVKVPEPAPVPPGGAAVPAPPPVAAKPGVKRADAPLGLPGSWTLTFQENFDGNTLNAEQWSSGFGWGAFNGNAWTASCTSPAALKLGGGTLTMLTSPDPVHSPECGPSGKTATSAAINTKGKFSQQFGFFEARIRMPGSRGIMGAWWLHRADGTWPPEIDIAEVIGERPWDHQMAVHFKLPGKITSASTGRRLYTVDLSQGFHVYGVDWRPNEVVFYLDGVESGRIGASAGALAQRGEYYLILNNAVCTSASRYWCQQPDQRVIWGWATSMEVDWVKVWQRP